jgi:curved DNA-binding protein CbpA
MAGASDPYKILGVGPEASEDQLRAAYRRLVRVHHPDHNHGSPESARRFEEIQEAYARIQRLRTRARADEPPAPAASDPNLEARLTDLEEQVRRAHAARERAKHAAAETAANEVRRPSDEELGYVKTDDSFAKILADAEAELSDRLGGVREHPDGRRVSQLIDELKRKREGDNPRGSRN